MSNTSHLVALHERLCRATVRLSEAETTAEKTFREMEARQAKREFDGELNFLKMPLNIDLPNISDDELLAALTN